jgi:hypothetical protein
MFKGKFPANDITWDNYKWAVRLVARWTGWGSTEKFFEVCRELRLNVPMEEVVQ